MITSTARLLTGDVYEIKLWSVNFHGNERADGSTGISEKKSLMGSADTDMFQIVFTKYRRFIFLVMSACNITTLQVWDTTYSADSVEWCPVEPYLNVFVCGTYHLVQNDSETYDCSDENGEIDKTKTKCQQEKLGSLHLMVVDRCLVTHKVQTLEVDAVLDTKWCPKRVENKTLLAAATAKGEILVFELSESPDLPEETQFHHFLTLLTKVKVFPDDMVLALSLDWNVRKKEHNGDESLQVVVSDSHGGISLLKFTNSTLIVIDCCVLHDYEAWIAAFDYWNPSVSYSGGDDNKFLVLDSRVGIRNPVLVNKSHEMGVTSICCNDSKEHLLVSGSYDEQLRFWDTRNLRKPISSTTLIGGIWRLKWDPQNFDHLLAACMYGGFCVINSEDVINPKVVTVYKEHKSIAYGCDWCFWTDAEIRSIVSDKNLKESTKILSLIATCSFYDHKLCVSIFDRNC
ncbi:diphthine methyltransferase [Gryllus bimaculatus]|nr:diphthine methyltransferase [Gryllus bimaculatus]